MVCASRRAYARLRAPGSANSFCEDAALPPMSSAMQLRHAGVAVSRGCAVALRRRCGDPTGSAGCCASTNVTTRAGLHLRRAARCEHVRVDASVNGWFLDGTSGRRRTRASDCALAADCRNCRSLLRALSAEGARARADEARPVTVTTPVPFVDLKAQFRAIRAEVVPRVMRGHGGRRLSSSAPTSRDLKKTLRRISGARYCVGVESGTAALELVLQALGIGPATR